MKKKYTIKGFTGTISEISKHFNINRNTINSRIRAYGICDAVVKPVRVVDSYEGVIYKACGFKGNVLSFSLKFNIAESAIRRYLKQRMEMEDILKIVKRKNQVHAVLGFQGTLKEISKHFNINYKTLTWNMYENGRTLEQIITRHINKMERKGIKYSEKLVNENHEVK